MRKIKAVINWNGVNYESLIENVGGVVVSTGKNYDEIITETTEGLKFHLEGFEKEDEAYDPVLANGEYELEFELKASALLKSTQDYISRSALARVTKINEKQLGHYIQGKREARPATREKIVEGIKTISENLAAIL